MILQTRIQSTLNCKIHRSKWIQHIYVREVIPLRWTLTTKTMWTTGKQRSASNLRKGHTKDCFKHVEV